MRIRGLTLLGRTDQKRRLMLGAWHSPHSLTWRWFASFWFAPSWHLWPMCGSWRANASGQWWFRVPFIGTFDFHHQRPMWYRDLYVALRERVDQESGMLWLPDSNPNKVHRVVPPPAPTVPGSPTIQ